MSWNKLITPATSGRLAWILLLFNGGFRVIPCRAYLYYHHTYSTWELWPSLGY